jgi:hypothetical protein
MLEQVRFGKKTSPDHQSNPFTTVYKMPSHSQQSWVQGNRETTSDQSFQIYPSKEPFGSFWLIAISFSIAWFKYVIYAQTLKDWTEIW